MRKTAQAAPPLPIAYRSHKDTIRQSKLPGTNQGCRRDEDLGAEKFSQVYIN